jgi:hypothetical protein
MAGTYPFTVIQGEDFAALLTWFQADGVTPIDLTGFHAVLIVEDRNGAGFNVSDEVLPGGYITLGGAAGTFQFTVPAATVARITGAVNYRLMVTNPSGVTACLLYGLFTLKMVTLCLVRWWRFRVFPRWWCLLTRWWW